MQLPRLEPYLPYAREITFLLLHMKHMQTRVCVGNASPTALMLPCAPPQTPSPLRASKTAPAGVGVGLEVLRRAGQEEGERLVLGSGERAWVGARRGWARGRGRALGGAGPPPSNAPYCGPGERSSAAGPGGKEFDAYDQGLEPFWPAPAHHFF